MAWRKWWVRGLVFTVAAGVAAAAFAYQHWTSPTIIRQQVLARLVEQLPGARVNLEAARLRLLGGISFSQLRLLCRDDPASSEFAYVPSGTIYHDKEHLLGGQLAIRKIEWDRPVLHVVRRRDGTWNTANLLSEPDLSQTIPTIVLRQATLFLEDQQDAPNQPPLEIKDLHLTIVNDPPLTLAIEGSGVTDLLGAVQLRGTFDRLSKAMTLSLLVPEVPVDGTLLQRLAVFCPQAVGDLRQLSGTARLQADLAYHPASADPLSYDVQLQLSHGQFHHARLPLPLEDLEIKARCASGQATVESLTARIGQGRLQLRGKAVNLGCTADLDGELKVEHLEMTPAIFNALGKDLQSIDADFQPRGTANVALEFQRRDGHWWKRGSVTATDASAICADFPYPLDRISGRIELDIHPDEVPGPADRVTIDVRGYTGTQPVTITAEVYGKRPCGYDVEIRGKNIPLDDKLARALPPRYQKLAASFHPTGQGDVEATLHRPQGGHKPERHYLIHFHDCTLRYDIFPYPVENVHGILDIQPDHWEFRDFHGTHNGAWFETHGGSFVTTDGDGVAIAITGDNVPLDGEMRQAMVRQPHLQTTWEELSPGGRIYFEAQIHDFPKRKDPDIAVLVKPQGATMRPRFFPYDLANVRGSVYYHADEVTIQEMSAQHGYTRLRMKDGKVLLKPDGGFSVDLRQLAGNPVLPDAEFVGALPPALRTMVHNLQLQDRVSLLAYQITVDVPPEKDAPPRVYWDGGLRVDDATLRAGVPLSHVSGQVWMKGEHHGVFGNVRGNLDLKEATLFKQPIRDIQSLLIVDAKAPDVLLLPNLSAHLFGGDVGGTAKLDFGAAGLNYEVNLVASQLNLETFCRHNQLGPDVTMSGLAASRLYLQGQGADLQGLRGEGSIDVPNGKILNLPPLLDLLKVLNLRLPDKTAFEEARIRFTIGGLRARVHRLELYGNSVSLTGEGTVNLNGTDLNLDFCAVPARVVQFLPPVLDKIPPLVSEQLLKIKMRGEIGKVECIKEPVPMVTDLVKDLLKRMRSPRGEGRGARDEGATPLDPRP
jgi:hypothetical protein